MKKINNIPNIISYFNNFQSKAIIIENLNHLCLFKFIFLLLLLLIHIFILISLFPNNKQQILIQTTSKKTEDKYNIIKPNFDLNDEFFQMSEIKTIIYNNNITHIETLYSSNQKVGNSLLIMNSLINICEKIRCKYIITPEGLKTIIKNPIYYKKYNITILPYSYKNKIKIDLKLDQRIIMHFKYRNKSNEMSLGILREEILKNIPKYNSNPNDLIIKLRSGDIFINHIHRNYSQPPLCFYQKIINENKFDKIYILSNGHENPVVDKLLKLYPKIKYMEGTLEEAISIIINAYNIVMPVSSFPKTLIRLNNNLKNLYVYQTNFINLTNANYTEHKMKPSQNYLKIMKNKWNNTKKQLDLMLNEKCKRKNRNYQRNGNIKI